MTSSPPLRWGAALAVVLALHVTAAWLLPEIVMPLPPPPVPEAVMLDLAPTLPPIQEAALAPSPLVPAPKLPPTPEPPPPAPPPPEVPTVGPPPPELLAPTPPVPADAVPPPPPPPPRAQPRPRIKTPERPIERPVERPLERPAARPQPAREAAAPAPPVPAPIQAPPEPAARPTAPQSDAVPSWRNELLGRLQRAKRYPDMARAHGDQGSVAVTFTMDRAGRVLSVTLARSSGSPLLDDEAVAMVHRAEPLPPVPNEIPGNTITFTIPVNFALR